MYTFSVVPSIITEKIKDVLFHSPPYSKFWSREPLFEKHSEKSLFKLVEKFVYFLSGAHYNNWENEKTCAPFTPIVKNFVPFASFLKSIQKKSLLSLVELMVTSSFSPLTTFSILKLSNWKTWGGGDENNLAQTGFMTLRASGQRPEAGLLNKLLSRAVAFGVTKFKTVRDMILVTLCFDAYVKLRCSTNCLQFVEQMLLLSSSLRYYQANDSHCHEFGHILLCCLSLIWVFNKPTSELGLLWLY